MLKHTRSSAELSSRLGSCARFSFVVASLLCKAAYGTSTCPFLMPKSLTSRSPLPYYTCFPTAYPSISNDIMYFIGTMGLVALGSGGIKPSMFLFAFANMSCFYPRYEWHP